MNNRFWKLNTRRLVALFCLLVLSAGTVFGQYVETEKLLASDAVSDAEFGNALGIDGGRAIIGAHYDYNLNGAKAGAAYIFELGTGGNWTEVAKIIGSDTQPYDGFGFSVDVSGDRLIVGVPLKNTVGTFAGAAYIFERDGSGNWMEAAKLIASNAAAEDRFGWSVAISGDYALVGAIYEDTGHTNAGSVYIFQRDSIGNWAEIAQIQPGDITSVQQFGYSLDLDGEAAVIGANLASHTGGSMAGAAYLFKRNAAGSWSEVSRVVASDAEANDQFGSSVSIDGGHVIIGAPFEGTGGNEEGAAYIFERDASGNWIEVAKIKASDAEPIDWFGEAVAINGSRAIVGAGNEDTGGSNTGAAYIFERDAAGNWSETAKIQASDHEPGENFGKSVGIGGSFVFVGAPKEKSGFLIENGAVYIFAGPPLNIEDSSVPGNYVLEQNFPNPFNPDTRIDFELPRSTTVWLKVFDINGKLVKILLNGSLSAGKHRVGWDGSNQYGVKVAGGVYFYQLKASNFRLTRKMLLMK